MRDLKDFMGIQFKTKVLSAAENGEEEDSVSSNELIYFSCVGSGFTNVARKVG